MGRGLRYPPKWHLSSEPTCGGTKLLHPAPNFDREIVGGFLRLRGLPRTPPAWQHVSVVAAVAILPDWGDEARDWRGLLTLSVRGRQRPRSICPPRRPSQWPSWVLPLLTPLPLRFGHGNSTGSVGPVRAGSSRVHELLGARIIAPVHGNCHDPETTNQIWVGWREM